MPNYDYKCEECSHAFSVRQNITAEKLKVCPECSTDSLRRLVNGSMATLRFTGKGYYITDYGSKKEGSCGGCSRKETCAKTE
jgi:putative FmdB family regulatory protein